MPLTSGVEHRSIRLMKIYTYTKCSTCRKATKWLNEQSIDFEEIPIRETPPSVNELRQMLDHVGDLKKLFNTSGMDYRALGMKDKLPTLSTEEALELLASNGNLIKRPFLIDSDKGTTGFKEDVWEALLK
ncbi:arsenate reductase family protein [Pontiellaceae bacterium B12227]|nr:arsenate reductase family protein [Pontiellaceae bacterium B12227]